MICGIVLRQYRNVTDTGALQTTDVMLMSY